MNWWNLVELNINNKIDFFDVYLFGACFPLLSVVVLEKLFSSKVKKPKTQESVHRAQTPLQYISSSIAETNY